MITNLLFSSLPRTRGPRAAGIALVAPVPAFEAVRKLIPAASRRLIWSFPRKREPRDFSRLLWAPGFAGATIFKAASDLIAASVAGMTKKTRVAGAETCGLAEQ
jgi:hypothetical protein